MLKKNKPPIKAFILAAGYGSRLGAITEHTPKPLVPIMGKPLLYHLLKQLEQTGIQEVGLNAFFKKEQIKKAVEEYPGNLNLHIIEEETLLGTGGGLANTEDWRDGHDLLVMNSDLIHTFNMREILEEYYKKPGELLFSLCTPAYPGKTLLWCQNGSLKSFRKPTSKGQSPHSFACIHIAPHKVLSSLPKVQENYGVMAHYEAHLKAGGVICCYEDKKAFWIDIGTPEDYLEGQMKFYRLMKSGVRLNHPCFDNPGESMNLFKKQLISMEKEYPGLLKVPKGFLESA